MSILLVIVPIIAVILIFGQRQSKRINQAWREAGRTLGLTFASGGKLGNRKLYGRVEDYNVDVHTFTRSSGHGSQTSTHYSVKYPRLDVDILLKSAGVFAGIQKTFGMQDIEIGESSFDEEVIVQGDAAEDVRRFLTPLRRNRIQRALGRFDGLEISSTEIEYARSGVVHSAQSVVALVRTFVRLADVLRSREETLDRTMEARQAGDLGAALELSRSAFEEDRDDPELVLSLAKDLLASGHPDEAAEKLAVVQADFPGDQEVAALMEETRNQTAATSTANDSLHEESAPEEPVAQAPEEPTDAPDTLTDEPADGTVLTDVASACESLFQSGTMSSDIRRTFEEHFEGRTVQWTGTLDRLEDYSWDVVFGQGPGTKALVRLHEVDAGIIGTREVHGILQLPRATAETLRNRRDEPIAFRGRLTRCDPFMRNLFVADATLDT
jgi:hypothetical protein